MKEGSFQAQMTGMDFNDEWKLEGVPLPNQVPDRLDLSQVPSHIVKSGVVDALISQNDDLMSRLAVALRRVALIEEKLSDARLESEQYRSQYENLNDQLLVLKEKSRSLYERKDREETEYVALREQIRMLEIRYGELYAASQNKESQLLKQFQSEMGELSRLRRYRSRVQRAADGLKKAAKEKWQAELNFAQSEQAQIVLRKNLAESAEYISGLSKDHKTQTQNLINQYESRMAELKTQLNETVTKNEKLGLRVHDYERLVEDKLRLENEVIHFERREDELQVRTAAEVSDLQRALARYKNEAKELAVTLGSTTDEFDTFKTEFDTAQTEKKALEEQVENLQVLWRNQQLQIEKSTEKVRSLQKLNQELSVAINQYRRDIRELKQDNEQAVLQDA